MILSVILIFLSVVVLGIAFFEWWLVWSENKQEDEDEH